MWKKTVTRVCAPAVLAILAVWISACTFGGDDPLPETGLPDGETSAPATEALTEKETEPAEETAEEDCAHVYGDPILISEPSCTLRGVKIRVCTVCSAYEPEVSEPTGHTEVTDPGKEALCTVNGLTEGKHCSVCGEVTVAQTVIPATGHTEETLSRVEPTCIAQGFAEGVHCSVCEEILSGRETIRATGHTTVVDPRVEPTCTEDGLSEGQHCGVCGHILYQQVVRPAKGHTEAITVGKEATCTEPGLTEGKHCSACGTVTVAQTAIPATGHTEAVLARVEPTCGEPGLTEGVGCSVCGTVLAGRKPIAALGHTVVNDPRVEPTCTEEGLSEGKHCRVCGKIVVAQQVLPASGHEEEIIPTIPATCTEGGMTAGVRCGRCGEVPVEPVPTVALGHSYDEYGVCIRCDSTNASVGLDFVSNGDGTCMLMGPGSCTDTHIVIPSVSPEGDLVTSFGYELYFGEELQSVTIPNTVTSVGFFFGLIDSSVELRFLGTRAELQAVTYMYDLMSTEQHYVTCTDGEVFTYGGAIEDARFAFTSNGDGTCYVSGIGAATNGVIPLYSPDGERVVAVGTAALKGQYLQLLAIPAGVTRIESEAFRAAEFYDVYVAETVTYIGDYAFAYTGAMGIGNRICKAVSSLPELTYLGKGALATNGTSENLTLTLPEGVTSVSDRLFAGGMWTDVQLILHRNVTYLGERLFDGWNTHASITFSGTVAEWNAIEKHVNWNAEMYPITITCLDGEVVTEDLNFRLD